MSGEHTHPDYEGDHASLRADLIAAAAELARVNASMSRLTAQVVALEIDAMEAHVIRYSPVFKVETAWSLDCDGDEHLLKLGANTRGEWVPPVAGRLDPACYVNVDRFDLKDPTKPARLMIWMRRKAWQGKPADDTFIYDIWLDREGLVHHDWRAFWERGEKDRPVYWLYKVTGANSVVVDTRYVKYSILT
jgi:hypothetical protein